MNKTLFIAWCNLRRRCTNSGWHAYKRYGGRGITYSQDWVHFKNFERDMEPTWFPGATLDRIDNDGNYCKENCRWITRKESSRKKSTTKISAEDALNIRLLYQTKEHTQAALAKLYGVTQSNISLIIRGKAHVS